MLCLSCFHLWPSGSLYCGHCGRSFGGRRCAKGHQSPAAATRCVLCGDRRLTQATAYVPLGWLYRGLAWLVVLVLLRLLWAHPGPLVTGASSAARRIGPSPRAASAAFEALIVWAALGLMALSLLPERFARPLGSALRWSARAVLRGAGRLLPLAWRGLRRIVGGP